MEAQWGHSGSYEGFAKHTQEACEPYDYAPINTDVWSKTRPTTSANAHLLLKATQLEYGHAMAQKLALQLRKSFFVEALDISSMPLILDIVQEQQLDPKNLLNAIENGSAMAALMSDHAKAQTQNIKGSPSWVMNDGRQIIYGNVGYRVLHANVEELLRQPENEAS